MPALVLEKIGSDLLPPPARRTFALVCIAHTTSAHTHRPRVCVCVRLYFRRDLNFEFCMYVPPQTTLTCQAPLSRVSYVMYKLLSLNSRACTFGVVTGWELGALDWLYCQHTHPRVTKHGTTTSAWPAEQNWAKLPDLYCLHKTETFL